MRPFGKLEQRQQEWQPQVTAALNALRSRLAPHAQRQSLALVQQPLNSRAATARLYAVAFALNPKQAEDPDRAAPFDAACAAAVAGCGRGADADKLDDKERAELRTQSRTWLRGLLDAHARQFKDAKAEDGERTQRTLANWQKEPRLAGVRDADALARLPDAERAEWEKLWQDVESLRQRTAKSK